MSDINQTFQYNLCNLVIGWYPLDGLLDFAPTKFIMMKIGCKSQEAGLNVPVLRILTSPCIHAIWCPFYVSSYCRDMYVLYSMYSIAIYTLFFYKN